MTHAQCDASDEIIPPNLEANVLYYIFLHCILPSQLYGMVGIDGTFGFPSLSPPPTSFPSSFPLQPMEIYIDDDTKLKLTSLRQHYVKLEDAGKNRKLFGLLDELEFNQVIFCARVALLSK